MPTRYQPRVSFCQIILRPPKELQYGYCHTLSNLLF
jgi:hypothetical protein